MINRTDFYEDDYDKLRYILENNLIDPDAIIEFNYSLLETAINEYADQCIKVLLEFNAKVGDDEWKLAILLNSSAINHFLKQGNPTESSKKLIKYMENDYYKKLFANFYCKKSVIELLCVAKKYRQPMSDMLRIIAKFLYATKDEIIWIIFN